MNSFSLSWCEKRGRVDYDKSGRDDFDVALTFVIVALSAGVRHMCARQDYDLGNGSQAETLQGRASRIRIGISSSHNSRVTALMRSALRFIYSLEPAVLGLFLPASLDQLDIVIASADSTSGQTYAVDINVLSEDIDEWTRWNREPERVLTILSRAHRQSVMSQV